MTCVAVGGDNRTDLFLEKFQLAVRLREERTGEEQDNCESHITQ